MGPVAYSIQGGVELLGLSYLCEEYNTLREQVHVISCVEKHVVQSISTQQGKETNAKCIAM